MRILGAIAGTFLVGFMIMLGFFWLKDGSLEGAGRSMDKTFEKVDQTTKPLQNEAKDVGNATKQTVKRATDGDDRT